MLFENVRIEDGVLMVDSGGSTLTASDYLESQLGKPRTPLLIALSNLVDSIDEINAVDGPCDIQT